MDWWRIEHARTFELDAVEEASRPAESDVRRSPGVPRTLSRRPMIPHAMPIDIISLPDDRQLVVLHDDVFRPAEAWCSREYRARVAVQRLAMVIED